MGNTKKIVITGASRGIGSTIAKAFSDQGAYVVGTCTSPIRKEFCSEWIISDFSDINQINECAERIKEIGPDVLINNAGINKISSFENIVANEFLLIHQINVFAPFRFCQAAIPNMKTKNWGRIINISSIWGKISKEFRASYSASKFALDGITLALAAEYSKCGILANCVSPGFTDTELTRNILSDIEIRNIALNIPINRLAAPNEIADYVLWLGSEKNTYVTGQNLAIDGGFTRV